MINRDLKQVLLSRGISREFLEEKLYSIYGGIGPKEFNEFYYIIYQLLNNHQLKERLIIDKLQQLSLEGPNEFRLAIFYKWNVKKRTDVMIEGNIEGNNMYDILLKYILWEFNRLIWPYYPTNPLSMLITDEVVFGELADQEIHTFLDLFNYLLIYFPIRDITNYIPICEESD